MVIKMRRDSKNKKTLYIHIGKWLFTNRGFVKSTETDRTANLLLVVGKILLCLAFINLILFISGS